ncbi:mitofusin-1-like [Zophobas morio]|uniref:mitofusin-1-like n=1 Tax=Zophobas morio TaxID=2755281 RepID=UPI003082D639
MLGQLILPIGIGHTTCSFCSVHGTDGDAYMIVSDPSDSCPAKDGHMNSQESLLSVLSESSEDNHQKEGDTASIRKDSMKKFRCSLTNVAQVASAVSPHSTNPTTRRLVNVFWQKNKCKLLRDEVVLIDSPGLDLDSDYNRWINDYCTDADVFVLVANAESTLKQTEREFFYKVLKKLSKPNIFMLYNRWDSSDMEHFIDERNATIPHKARL